MRYVFLLMLAFSVTLLSPVENAWSQERDGVSSLPEAVYSEQSLDEAVLQATSEKIQITLKNGMTYEVPAQAVSGDDLKPFQSLSVDQQAAFKERRLKFLAGMARILNATKLALGAGSLVGKTLSFAKNATLKAVGREVEVKTDSATFKERSRRVVQALLNAFDHQLWAQAPLLVSANEYGLSASVAVIGVAGYREHGFGGIQELGVSFAYNREQKAMVFELFHTSEKFHAGEPFSAVLGVAPKVGVMINKQNGAESLQKKGTAHGVPVLPAYFSSGADNLTLNGMLTLGLPPTPLSDILPGFATHFEKNTLLRVTVSPLVKGYIRLEVGDVRGTLMALKTDFISVWQALGRRIQALRFGTCGRVFAAN